MRDDSTAPGAPNVPPELSAERRSAIATAIERLREEAVTGQHALDQEAAYGILDALLREVGA